MPDPVQNFFKTIGSHLVVTIITALITVSLLFGSYKTKIDTLTTEASQTRVVLTDLNIAITDLRIEVSALKREMELGRRNR